MPRTLVGVEDAPSLSCCNRIACCGRNLHCCPTRSSVRGHHTGVPICWEETLRTHSSMRHIPVYLVHHKFKLPVKSDHPHSHSHTSVSWPKTSLFCSLLTFPILTMVLSVNNLAPILPQLLPRLPSLQRLNGELSSEHTPLSAACFNEPYIFSSICWTSGLGVDLLATAFNHFPHPPCSCNVMLLWGLYQPVTPYPLLITVRVGISFTHDSQWSFLETSASSMLAFSFLDLISNGFFVPWSSPNTTHRTFSSPGAASPPSSLPSNSLAGNDDRSMIPTLQHYWH